MTVATVVKSRPFNAYPHEVRAMLADRQTQFRRVVKLHLEDDPSSSGPWVDDGPSPSGAGRVGHTLTLDECPYGVPGDLLWVRETWARSLNNVLYRADCLGNERPAEYTDEWDWGSGLVNSWRSPMRMSKHNARLWLRVVKRRAERVQEITAWDALQEGVDLAIPAGCNVRGVYPEYATWTKARQDDWVNGEARAIYFSRCADAQDHIDEFQRRWDILNAKRGYPWSNNDWVWAVTFERAEKPA